MGSFFMNSTDYVCTPRDITVIESIMSALKKTMFVDIEDAFLSNDNLECLMKDDIFLHDDARPICINFVINNIKNI